ncbi:MAG: hypothetical protein P1V97_04405 [Planctomycetota bacterium]|nr:hypothetical protein [Planctomycetota bacterium]
METPRWVTKGFVLSGIMNIVGVLLATHGFTAHEDVMKWDPGAFSLLGLVCIPIWGLTYIAVAKHVAKLPNIALVFFIEKLVYITNYAIWISERSGDLPAIYEDSLLPGVFFTIYGANDLIFGLFFGIVFLKLKSAPKADA